jgi:hypothetical protein
MGETLDWAKHVTDRIAAAPMCETPWRHLHVTEVFPADFYARLVRGLPKPHQLQPLSYKTTMRHVMNFYDDMGVTNTKVPPQWCEVRDELFDPLREILEARFGIRGSYIRGSVVYDRPGYELGPHTDMPDTTITALFYLPKDDSTKHMGTVLVRGRDPDRAGRDHAWGPEFSPVVEVPYVPNSALFFQRTDASFHAVRKTDQPRWTLAFNVMGRG